jgi:ribonuclease P protein component
MSDEAHLSAEQSGSRTASRLPVTDGNGGRTRSDPGTSCSRPQKAQRLTTLRKRRDFLAANASRRLATPGFVLLIRDREDESIEKRVGFTVTKKIGNAIVRNRLKRRLRALAYGLIPERGRPGCDHVLIGRAGGVERTFAKLRAELEQALAKANR